MTDTAAAQTTEPATTWSVSAPHVKKALAFIRSRAKADIPTNSDDLVEWDRQNGRRLFNWNDASAGERWRAHQALLFLNRFRHIFERMRVRAFIHVREDAAADIAESGYMTVETIAAHPGMRAQVINDLTRRMRTLASELKMWKLTPDEQRALFEQLAEAMSGRARKRDAA